MFKNRRRQEKTIVGLEMDPSHLAAAQVAVNGRIAVTKGAVATLRPGILRDGEVVDPVALTEALRSLFAEHELPTQVRLGIANQRIVVRTLDVGPVTDPKALEALVRAEAPNHLPVPMDEAVLDFQPLGDVDTPAGPRTRVVIVALRRDMVDRMIAATREAGLDVVGIDLSAFGMVRALHAPGTGSAVLYVNLAGLINVAVANDTGCLFTRAASGGLEPMVQTLEEGVHTVADTVRNSLNFYRMQENAESVDRAVLTGPAVAIPGFAARLSEQLQMPVETGLVAVREGDADMGRLTVAAGLAVDETP